MARGRMTSAEEAAKLKSLVALIEDRFRDVGAAPNYMQHEEWKAHHRKGLETVEDLVLTHGGRYRPAVGGAGVLKIATVQTSCTCGNWGLLRNWQTAARRRIALLEKEGAPCSS